MRRFGNGWWLPAGPMRERAGRLKSVDVVSSTVVSLAAVKSHASAAWLGGEFTYRYAL
ncbi:tetraacyldisaccharide 4'-kinase [Shigella flexneri]